VENNKVTFKSYTHVDKLFQKINEK